jgi:DNA invertase Pin-like site-specific DNA recombinase
MASKKKPAVAYLRTSSQTNANRPGLAADKDSDQRQRAAVVGYAKANGYEIVDEFYDVVSGADPINDRPGFKAMLDRITSNGVRSIIVESPDRFARDLMVSMTGHEYLKTLGVELIPASDPNYFEQDTPTGKLIRQVLGAISEFEKASLVAKLKAARDRKKAATGKCGGRKSYKERDENVVILARQLRRKRPKGGQRSLREVAAELARLGYVNEREAMFSPSAVAAMLEQGR